MMRDREDATGTAYTVSNCIEVSGTQLELRHYGSVPAGGVVSGEAHSSIGMLISSRPIYARYLTGSRHAEYRRIGRMMFRPRDVPWESNVPDGPIESLVCTFEDDRLVRLSEEVAASPTELEECLHLRSPQMAYNLQCLEAEVRVPGFASEMLVEGMTMSLVVQLTRHLARREPAKVGRKPATVAANQMRMIEDYLTNISDRMPRVSDLAGLCGMSDRQLMRAFKQTTGQAVGEYVANRQSERAKALLRDRRLCLKEISFKLGFSSHSNFTNSFRRTTGLSPTEFRRRLG